MGKRGYPPEFRRRVLDLVEAGRTVAWALGGPSMVSLSP
jgi:hypothetical protein